MKSIFCITSFCDFIGIFHDHEDPGRCGNLYSRIDLRYPVIDPLCDLECLITDTDAVFDRNIAADANERFILAKDNILSGYPVVILKINEINSSDIIEIDGLDELVAIDHSYQYLLESKQS